MSNTSIKSLFSINAEYIIRRWDLLKYFGMNGTKYSLTHEANIIEQQMRC